ncbi:MAG: EF-P beta-lysylation protein EpmB [Nitrococcus sp.]|nr:EF-P beta-lysylation protein EpmB [Nitrococcus sp.]
MSEPSHAARRAPASVSWQRELARAVRDPAELIRLLGLPPTLLEPARLASRQFPLRVPHAYIARMESGNPEDPLLRQVLPLAAELDAAPGFVADPVGDLAASRGAGVLHKYYGRVLLITTGACAVNCRYCFRRHFPYTRANASAEQWLPALRYIARRPEIEEVILSGGDPLSLTDRRLAQLVAELVDIPHVRRLRVHSRLPVVLPTRITQEMLSWFAGSRLQAVMVLHANHANELDDAVAKAVRRLREAGVTVLNQTVVLRGVNDEAKTLTQLSRRLFDLGILPYYLHLLDRVAGASHFAITQVRARALHRQMAARLPGYLVPRLVQEIEGTPGKRWLAP